LASIFIRPINAHQATHMVTCILAKGRFSPHCGFHFNLGQWVFTNNAKQRNATQRNARIVYYLRPHEIYQKCLYRKVLVAAVALSMFIAGVMECNFCWM